MSWDGYLKRKLGIDRKWTGKKKIRIAYTKCLLHQSAGILQSQLISQHHARFWNVMGRDQIITFFSGIFVHLLIEMLKHKVGDGTILAISWMCVLNHIWVYVSGFSEQTETDIVWVALYGSSMMDSMGHEWIGIRGLLRTLIFLSTYLSCPAQFLKLHTQTRVIFPSPLLCLFSFISLI